MSTPPASEALFPETVRDSTYSAGTFGHPKTSTSPSVMLDATADDVEGLRTSLASSHLAVEPSDGQHDLLTAKSSLGDDDDQRYEQISSPVGSPLGSSFDADVDSVAVLAVASASPLSLSNSPRPAASPTPGSHASSPTEETFSHGTRSSNESHNSASPLVPNSDDRESPAQMGLSDHDRACSGSDARTSELAGDGEAGARTPRQRTGTEGLSSEELTAKEKAVLMRRARKLERVLGSTLQEHQVTQSLSHSRSGSQSVAVPSSPTRATRRLSDPSLSPSMQSFLGSPASPASRRASLALSVDSTASDGSPSSPTTRRRRSSVSTLNASGSTPWSDGHPASSSPPKAVLSDAQRRLRLQKIHRMLGAEVGPEHVFASTPGAGPWLEDGRGSPSPQSAGTEIGGRVGWKGVVGKARDTLGRGTYGRKDKERETDDDGATTDVGGGGSGEEEVMRASCDDAGRMGGVKRGAKLNNIFGDFPPTSLYHRSALAADGADSAVLAADDIPPSRPVSSIYLDGRRNSSQSSFSLFDASISQLDRLLRTDPETLSVIMSSIHDADVEGGAPMTINTEETSSAPVATAVDDPTAALVAELARRRQAAKKLSHFFGMPASALGLFQSTIDTLQEGVREERERGLLEEGEEKGLLGRLDGLRRRAGRELGDAQGE